MKRRISASDAARADSLRPGVVAIVMLLVLAPQIAHADEGGVSFWLPGQFGSLAAVPQTPGWSAAAVYYHTSIGASGDVAAAREIQIGRIPANVNVSLNANLNAQADLMILASTYNIRQARARWPTRGRADRHSWPVGRIDRRNADRRDWTDHVQPFRQRFGIAHGGRRPLSDGDAEVE